MTPEPILHCALCKERLALETTRADRPFMRYSASHWGPTSCLAQTTWVYVWKDAGFWESWRA